jgi:CheY-like chemotaxis protein
MKKVTVIVVDDNLVSRLLPSFILRPYGSAAQVLECETGLDALRLIEIHQVTHVLLDISMPGMDGSKVAQKIREVSKYSEIRLIAYTADVLATDETYLRAVGFDDVLLKPLKSADLLLALGILDASI